MMLLTISATQSVYLTLKEKQTLASPNYLFVFTQRTTNDVIAFVKLNNTDISAHKERYNEFSLVTNTHFTLEGEYHYAIYEQTSTSNVNPSLAATLLETGIARVIPASANEFEYLGFESENNYITR
jgi:hypothetical protein